VALPDGMMGVLTATNVPGKKNIPSTAIVFMAKLSFWVSTAMLLITSLSFLLA
jgi:hypothetical protein